MQGMAALEASDIGEISAEGEAWGGGHGVFTYYLLKGLGGAADANGDGTVTAEELFRYVQREVSKATHDSQLPMTAVGQQGGVPLAGVLSGRSNDERAAKH
jgi:uncharacterized caspase-like protein